MARQDVLVVKEIFMLDGAYVQKGDVIDDAAKMARASAQHPEKVIATAHDIADPAPIDPKPVAPAAPAPAPVSQASTLAAKAASSA